MVKPVIFMFFCLAVLLFSCASKKTESKDSVKDTTSISASPSEVNSTDATDGEGSPAIGKTSNPGRVMPTTATFLGFSPDLKYTAFDVFESSWAENDASRYIIEVDKNAFATKPFIIRGGDVDMNAVRDSLLETGVELVKNYNINGNNPGTRIPLDSTRSDNDILIDKKSYTLRLIQVPAPNKGMMFELHLLHESDIQVLQKDRQRPESRGVVANYYLKDAWIKANKIAVMIWHDSEPYEMEGVSYLNRRCMMVTGVIK